MAFYLLKQDGGNLTLQAGSGSLLLQGDIQLIDSQGSGYQAASSNYTFDRVCAGPNRFLAVDIALLSVAGTTVVSVTDDDGGGNVPMTLIGVKSSVSGTLRVECWGLVAPVLGTKTIRVILSASIASVAMNASYYGVHQTTPTEAFNGATAVNVGAADATVTITTTTDRDWVHAAVVSSDGSITANQTTRNNVTGAAGSGADEDTGAVVTPAGAQVMSYTGVGIAASWAIAGYGLRPVGAASAVALDDEAGLLFVSRWLW